MRKHRRLRLGLRVFAAGCLLTLGTLLLFFAIICGWLYLTIGTADHFADTAVTALQRPAVRAELAERLTEQIVRQRPDLVTVRPLLTGVIDGVIGSDPFRRVLTPALREAHRHLFAPDSTLLLDLSDGAIIVLGALNTLSPSTATSIPPDLRLRLNELVNSGLYDQASVLYDLISSTWWAALVAGLGGVFALVAALLISPQRRITLMHLGCLLAIGALAIRLGNEILRGLVLDSLPTESLAAAVDEVWEVLVSPLFVALRAVGLGGFILALAVLLPSGLWRVHWQWTLLQRITRAIARSRYSRAVYLAGTLLLMAAGAGLVARPALVLTILIRVAGVVGLYVGGAELLRVLGITGNFITADFDQLVRLITRGSRPLVVTAVIGLASTVGVQVWYHSAVAFEDTTSTPTTIDRCNGYAELCDRRLNEVVFATTHNSMSAAREPGWYFASHDGGIPVQLAAGVRALLIDVHYGYPGPNGVSTDESDAAQRKIIEAGFDQETIDAARRLVARRVTGAELGTEHEIYLCHGFCELGATSLDITLQELRYFLQVHPNEVIILFFEDYVKPADLEVVFKRNNLLSETYTYTPGQPWPTLRELIQQRQRLVVLSEKVGTAPHPAWYHDGFALVQETPYSFKQPSDFSCAPNRGQADAPLFLLNHWIEKTTPSVADAIAINAYDVLLNRARRCQQERGKLPNLIAVNFFEVGDLFRVVATLNDVLPRAPLRQR